MCIVRAVPIGQPNDTIISNFAFQEITVTVQIIDTNNNPPVLTLSAAEPRFAFPEGISVWGKSIPISRVSVHDNDSFNEFEFSVSDGQGFYLEQDGDRSANLKIVDGVGCDYYPAGCLVTIRVDDGQYFDEISYNIVKLRNSQLSILYLSSSTELDEDELIAEIESLESVSGKFACQKILIKFPSR